MTVPLLDPSLPCFCCGRHRLDHPVPGKRVCRRWHNPVGRTVEPAVARDRRLDPPPEWLAADIAADEEDAAVLDRFRRALVTVADVVDGERPGVPGPGTAVKVILALARRGLLARPPDEACPPTETETVEDNGWPLPW